MNSQHPDNVSLVHMQINKLKLLFSFIFISYKNTTIFLINWNKLALEYTIYD